MPNLRALTTQTMISVTAAWLDPKRDRPLLAKLPLLAPLLPALHAAHEGLVANQKLSTGPDPALGALQAEAVEVDAEHDRALRAIHGVLTAFAELPADEDEANAYLALRDKLFPAGLLMVSRSYVDEGAEAELVAARLDKSDHALLAKLPIPGGKLKDTFEIWMGAARRLKAIEAKRRVLEAKSASTETVRAGDALRARTAWIRAVRAVETNLDLEEHADPRMRVALLGPLELAIKKAAPRASAKTKSPNEAQPPEDETTA